MATTWGQLTWGNNSWGTDVNTISVSGEAATFSLGNVSGYPGQGWGANTWNVGEWGSVNTGNQLVTGLSMSMDIGQVDQTSSTGWGRSSWGSNVWNGYGTVIPSGVSATMALSTQILIDAEINRGWGRQGWNENAWGIGGQVLANNFSLPMTLANVSIDNEINTGWGSDTWGYETWGTSGLTVTLSGQVLTLAEGSAGLSFDGDSNLTLTGNHLTMATPSSTEGFASFTAEVTGQPMTMTLSYDPEVVIPTGFALTATLGDEDAEFKTIAEVNAYSPSYWGYKSTWGYSAWGNGQTNTLVMSMLENFSGADPGPDANATGQAMAAALAAGNTFDISGDANIAPLANMNWGQGTWGESTWGDGLYRPDTDDIFPLTMALGTATLDALTPADITGLPLLSMYTGTPGTIGDANVIPTGFGLTFAVGSGTNALIWNKVPTGSAPVTPPGWKEVPTNAA